MELYVGGLPYSVTSDRLQKDIIQYVPEATVYLPLDRMTGRTNGFGFISVPDIASAQVLIDVYNGKDFQGRILTVNEKRPMTPRDARGFEERLSGKEARPILASLMEPIAELVAPPQLMLINFQDSLVDFFAKHPKLMRSMPHRRFEELIAELWQRFGYEVELQKQTRDGGIDIIAIRQAEVSTRFLIQCKRPEPHKKVSINPVRELFGVKQDFGASKAILATTVYFTPDAQKFIDRHYWELEGRDYDGIVSWLNQAMGGTGSKETV